MIYPMSDETARSFEEGQAACPFVAFEDDRDHRADAPDYRHRCFAAAEPEPRAIPHQERFCLSAAFAQCPIFLDWARQEAAGVLRAANAAAAAGTAESTAELALAPAKSKATAETPAFLANRGRTTPAEAAPVAAHSTSDPGSGLWGFEGAPKRMIAPATTPATGSGAPTAGSPAYAMARRQPTRPDWENPPRMDKYPRLRARDDRNNNQPLLLAALGVAVLMVALIVYPILTNNKGGGVGGTNPSASQSHIAGGPSASATDSPSPTPQADRTLRAYLVRSSDKNLTSIAANNGISLQQLELANPQITNYNVIYVGMTIYIPWQTWTPPAPTPSLTPTPVPTPTPKATPTPSATPTSTY